MTGVEKLKGLLPVFLQFPFGEQCVVKLERHKKITLVNIEELNIFHSNNRK